MTQPRPDSVWHFPGADNHGWSCWAMDYSIPDIAEGSIYYAVWLMPSYNTVAWHAVQTTNCLSAVSAIQHVSCVSRRGAFNFTDFKKYAAELDEAW